MNLHVRKLRPIGLAVAFVALFFGALSVKAQEWQWRGFVESLDEEEASFFDFRFIREGLEHLSFIKFKPGHSLQYREARNYLLLQQSMSDGGRRLLPFSEISALSLGFLYHEIFHSYVENVAHLRNGNAQLRNWLRMRSDDLYADVLEKKYRPHAMEEAYASVINDFVMSAIWAIDVLEHAAEEDEVDCIKIDERIDRTWGTSWRNRYDAYYTPGGFVDWWGERIKWGLDKVFGDGNHRLGERYINAYLTKRDLRWISSYIFEGRLKEDPYVTFRDHYEAIGCLPEGY